MDVLLWGISLRTYRIEEECIEREVNILAYVDNNTELWGTEYWEVKVIPPFNIRDYDFQYVIVVSSAFNDIKTQLLSIGVDKAKILSYVYSKEDCLLKLGEPKFLLSREYKVKNSVTKRLETLYRIEGKVVEDVSPPLTKEQQYSLIERLLNSYNLAQKQMQKVTEEYKVGENWFNLLKGTRKKFYETVENGDVSELTHLLNNFFRNCMSTAIGGDESTYKTFEKTIPIYPYLTKYFKVWKYSVKDMTPMKELAMPSIGNPFGYKVDGACINISCFLNHYRAVYISHLAKEEEMAVIGEIGGGYGGFAYYLLKQQEDKLYIGFDIPENLIISSYYLSMAFPEKRILLYENPDTILNKDSFNNYDIILMPNFMLPKLEDLSVDIFVNTISMSEMDYSTITEYFHQIERCCKKYFYHENLAHAPFDYKGYPASVFPEMKSFKEMMACPSRWEYFGMHSPLHTYKEHLCMRQEQT